jgi:hypothetical protein
MAIREDHRVHREGDADPHAPDEIRGGASFALSRGAEQVAEALDLVHETGQVKAGPDDKLDATEGRVDDDAPAASGGVQK